MLSIACRDARSVSKGALSGPSLGRPLARGSDEQCGRSSGAAGPLDARTGKIASLMLTFVAQASVVEGSCDHAPRESPGIDASNSSDNAPPVAVAVPAFS